MTAKPKVRRSARHEWRAEFTFSGGTNAVVFHTWREAYDYALDIVHRRMHHTEPCS